MEKNDVCELGEVSRRKEKATLRFLRRLGFSHKRPRKLHSCRRVMVIFVKGKKKTGVIPNATFE
jgi:hypothetical protein